MNDDHGRDDLTGGLGLPILMIFAGIGGLLLWGLL